MSILGIGDADVDIFIEVEKFPSYDEKVFSRATSLHVGGMVLNFLVCLKSLENECEYVGVIGGDKYGEKILNFLKEKKIKHNNIVIDNKGETYYCYIILDKLGEKSLIIVPTDCLFISEYMIKDNIFQNIKHVHTTSGNINTALKIINIANKKRISVSIDLENICEYNLFSKLVKDVEILFINLKTFKQLGFEDFNRDLEIISELGPKVICLTRGKDGAITFTHKGVYAFDGFEVEVKDTTGAGDCYAAGFLHGYIRGWNIERSTIFANAVASLSTTTLGGSSFRMTENNVNTFINSKNILKNV